jgi:hypothetical protein
MKYLGIKNKVVLWSLIGNSIVEIYVPEASSTTVLENIEMKDGTAIRNPNIWLKPDFMEQAKFEQSTLARLKWQTKNSKFQNLTSCIMQGVPAHLEINGGLLQEMIAGSPSSLLNDKVMVSDFIDKNALVSGTMLPARKAELQASEIHSPILSQIDTDVNMDQTDDQVSNEAELPNVVVRATAPTQC